MTMLFKSIMLSFKVFRLIIVGKCSKFIEEYIKEEIIK